jgi:AcrR family transcriptional regulator
LEAATRIPTEQRIVAAATTLFYEKGYHAATMREVAAAAGIKAGSLYNHFRGKEELLFIVATRTMQELLDGGRQAMAEGPDAQSRLRGLVKRHVVYHAKQRCQAKVADEQLHALPPERRADVVEIRDAYEQLFAEVLESGRAEHGWIVADARVVTFAITTMCTGVDAWYREDGRLAADAIADIYADFVLAALSDGQAPSPRSRSFDGS